MTRTVASFCRFPGQGQRSKTRTAAGVRPGGVPGAAAVIGCENSLLGLMKYTNWQSLTLNKVLDSV